MVIKEILISNFKSLKKLRIPIQSYGEGKNKSNTAFLVGINESGKSAILDSISLFEDGLDEINYEDDCFIGSQEKEELIDITAIFEFTDMTFWQKQLKEKLQIPESLLVNLKLLDLQKNIYTSPAASESAYDYILSINELPFHEYIIQTNPILNALAPKNTFKDYIVSLKEINKNRVIITKENASTFLKEGQKLLTQSYLEEEIIKVLKDEFDKKFPNIQIWKPKSEYLINDKISLKKFKEDPNISIPLRNIFYIYGSKTDTQIKHTIDRALSSQARCDELQNKMSETITKHINNIWKEHKIKFRVSINGDNCEVHVEDKDKKFTYYKMDQRSDGFKQFISLILSLSALNESNSLNNNIILIDEPEVHLHPSGVRYMRDEILKIGKKNMVFVATHSHYMVDTNCPERHWIVAKEKGETKISQISKDTPIEDDSVLSSAFGLNLFKELLPENILIVEGADDKSVIKHVIKELKINFNYSIKTAKGASKAYGIASLLANEEIPAYFLFDDDKEGRDYKRKIIEELGASFNENNVFTLYDIEHTLPQRATLEDLLPKEFLIGFFKKELNQDFNLLDTSPVIKQIIEQNKSVRDNKNKLDTLKVKLSDNFIKEFNSKIKIEKNAPRFASFVKNLIAKIEN